MLKTIKLESQGLALCIISLLVAYIYFDMVLELMPCTLCLIDRFLIIAIFILFLAIRQNIFPKITNIMAIFFSILGTISASWHIYIQEAHKNLEEGDFGNGCGADIFYYIKNLPFSEAIEKTFTSSSSCVDVDWTFLGLTIPAYTLILFIILLIISFKIFIRNET